MLSRNLFRNVSNWTRTGLRISDIPDEDFVIKYLKYEGVRHTLLFSKTGSEISAISGTCTHRPVLLSKAIRDGDDLRCFCHGAVFDLRSGAVKGAPATKPLPKFDLKIENDEISINLDAKENSKIYEKVDENLKPVCVIGAGAAGTALASELVKNNFNRPIQLITKEDIEAPYDRTMLSKTFSALHYSDLLKNENVTWRGHTEVTSIDPDKKIIRLKIAENVDRTQPHVIGKCRNSKKWKFEEIEYSKLVLGNGQNFYRSG